VLFDLFDALGPRAVALPAPPASALTVPNAALPRPLRRFAPRGTLQAPGPGQRLSEPLSVQFPPDGAVVELSGPGLTVRVRGGTPPYSWLLNGAPVAVGQSTPTAQLPAEPGFSALSVIDAEGRSARVGFRALPPGQ